MPSHPKHALLRDEQRTRSSSRRAPQRMNLKNLGPRSRASGLRKYTPNTICGVQAGAAAAPEDEADVLEGDASAWATAANLPVADDPDLSPTVRACLP